MRIGSPCLRGRVFILHFCVNRLYKHVNEHMEGVYGYMGKFPEKGDVKFSLSLSYLVSYAQLRAYEGDLFIRSTL